ncbi:MAG: dipeptidase [Propionicimonas sp.]|nr:dipeptidase [Propionicimonas sp.]
MTDLSRTEAVRAAVADGFPEALSDLAALVAIPSIAFDAFPREAVETSARAVAERFEATGLFDQVSIRTAVIPATGETGMPAVLATRAAKPGCPTVLLYAHHDVQPVGDPAQWDTPPFALTERDGRLYGRGSSDDKAGVVTHLAALRAASRTLGDDFGAGVAVFIEGEEETGSRSFAQFLADNREALTADVIVVADSGNWDAQTPGLTVSLRGNVRFTLKLRTLAHASHSGMFGGAVPDAMMATVTLLSTLWDADGAVAVAGLTSREADTPDYTEDDLRREAGLLPGVSPVGHGTILSRLWNQPSITITGIDAPSVANASNTISPEASVVISARVAPGQSAREAYQALAAHLRAHAPFGAELSFSDIDYGDAFLADTSGWAADLAKHALTEAFGRAPVEIGQGGSIPFVADLARTFPQAQLLITAVEDPLSRPHTPNESQHINTLSSAILAEALVLAGLATS